MATAKQVQLSDVPYTEDWNTYEYLVSVNAALASLQEQVDALSNRIDKEGVITGGDDTTGWYVKLPGGMLIQGKKVAANAGEYGKDLVWPIEFIDTTYAVVSDATANTQGDVLKTWVWQKSKRACHVGVRQGAGLAIITLPVELMGIAIGRWK
jgi:hypothetical protein